MILSGSAIKEYISAGLITIKPRFDETQLRPFGLRLHLAGEILHPKNGARVDLSKGGKIGELFTRKNIYKSPLVLNPGDFALGSCIELIKMDSHILGMLDGRNTLARLGILIHCSSNVLDGNTTEFRSVVIEIKNTGPFEVAIPYRYPIRMMLFYVSNVPASSDLIQPQYKNQKGVKGPNLKFVPPQPRSR